MFGELDSMKQALGIGFGEDETDSEDEFVR
jgi:hypothetical protein